MKLPWKDPSVVLPDNYELSLRKLHSLLNRLRQKPDLLRQYDQAIQHQVQAGIVQLVSEESLTGDRTHYLPHHAVIKRDKDTTNVRIVYDASAKTAKGPSLNDCLHIGPKFNQKLFCILLRFRAYRVPIIADIEKAFLMIAVDETDRDVLHFLWVKDVNENPPEIVVFRFARVVFGVASSLFLLNATVQNHLDKYSSSHPRLVEQLLSSMYVDDIFFGEENEDETFQLYKEAKDILQEGGFNLRKFLTSVCGLQRRVDQMRAPCQEEDMRDETYTQLSLGKSLETQSGEHKVLGVKWNVCTDDLIVDLSEATSAFEESQPTKQNMISIVSKFYNPLGFLSPAVIKFKILFQELSTSKLSWD